MHCFSIRASRLLLALLLLGSTAAWAGIDCDGVDDFADFAQPTVFDCANMTCTFVFWAKSNSSIEAFFSKATGTGGGYNLLTVTQDQLDFTIRSGGANMAIRQSAENAMTPGAWKHVAVVMTTDTAVRTNNVVSLYLDGAVNHVGAMNYDDVSPGYTTNTGPLRLCKTASVNQKDLEIDDFAVIGRALTAEEIAGLAASRTRLLPVQAALQAYVPMDTCTPGISTHAAPFPDRSGNAATLTPDRSTNATGVLCEHRGLLYPRGVE